MPFTLLSTVYPTDTFDPNVTDAPNITRTGAFVDTTMVAPILADAVANGVSIAQGITSDAIPPVAVAGYVGRTSLGPPTTGGPWVYGSIADDDFGDIYQYQPPTPPATQGAWLLIGHNEATGPAGPSGATVPVVATGAPSDAGRSLQQRIDDEVVLDDFHVAADGSNYALTLGRALAYAVPLGKAVRLKKLYSYSSGVTLTTGTSIRGEGIRTGFVGPTDAPVTLFTTTTGTTDIHLSDFLHDGGVTTATTTKNFTRGMRFQDSQRIRLTGMVVKNCADWACSFERCTDVIVINHRHVGGGLGLPGGRDGLHFLDCATVLVDDADMDTGDDCVAFTHQTVGTSDVVVRNVRGRSDIGSMVISNEEGTAVQPVTNFSVSGVRTKGTARDVVRVQAINAGTVISGVKVSDVKGTSTNHGIQIAGTVGTPMRDVSITDFDVTSTTQHGCYVQFVDSFDVIGAGKSTAGTFDGIQLASCTRGYVKPRSRLSSLWGLQVNACTDVTVDTPALFDNGVGGIGTASGGNLRVVNSTDVEVLGGSCTGTTANSQFGISSSGNTRLKVSPTTRLGGVTPISPATGLVYGTPTMDPFTANGTWTKPSGATAGLAICIAGGGGGASGAQTASGTAASGGGGGGGGGLAFREFPAATLGATETIVVGSGGNGASGQATASTAGTAGSNGGSTTFGAHLKATAGNGGGAGQVNAASTAGAGGAGTSTGGNGGTGANGGVGAGGGVGGSSGGGGGGGISSGGAAQAGGVGQPASSSTFAGGTAGTAGGGAGGAGPSGVAGEPTPGSSGGGGGGGTTTPGGAGGAGGSYGAAGGGGGASLNGQTSGAGGNGAPGICYIISW